MIRLIRTNVLCFFFLVFFISPLFSQENGSVELPKYILSDVETEIKIPLVESVEPPIVYLDDQLIEAEKKSNFYIIPFKIAESSTIRISYQNKQEQFVLSPIPIWLSIIPPLIAILLALIFKEVVTALFLGLFFGAFILEFHQHGPFLGWLFAFMRSLDTYLLAALNDSGHLSVIIFSLLIGAMVNVISKNGGMRGVVNSISKYARSPRSGQFSTWLLGIAIFFDDYANTLVVGKTMRVVTDRLRISREKLAYLVDSTAAPIASIALITTWIGAELGYIEDGVESIAGLDQAAYSIFLNSLAYSYYPYLALIFILILIYKGRDFGPMLDAERMARFGKAQSEHNSRLEKDEWTVEKKEDPKPKIRANKWMAIVPILILLITTIIGLFYTGYAESVWSSNDSFFTKLSITVGQADSYQALLWGSAASVIAAIKLSVFFGGQKLGYLIEEAIEGIKSMIPAMIILILAWSLAEVIEELHTAEFLSSSLSGSLSPTFLPLITFILSALIAFSTGSSWGTMAILYPLILPLSWKLGLEAELATAQILPIFYNVVSCVLAGSVLGDHCSPISDTTILSSLASDCNHIQHVRTQLPYALTVGIVACIIGTLPAAYGVPFYINFPIAVGILWAIVHFFGQSTEEPFG